MNTENIELILLKHKNVIVIVIIVLVVAFVSKKIYAGYLNKNAELDNKIKKIEIIETSFVRLRAIDKQLKAIKTNIFKGDIFDFKRLLEHTAGTSDITIESFKPQIIKETKEYRKMAVNLSVNSGYKGLTKLVRAIENTSSATILRLDRRSENIYAILFDVAVK